MPFNINDFRGTLTGHGARPTLFQVEMTMPTGDPVANRKLTFTAKAASLSPEDINPINVSYKGRDIKVAGDRTFPEWTVTIINDEDFLVRDALEKWNQSINLHVENVNVSGGPGGYKQNDARVQQFSKTGQLIREYTFKNIWPSNIAAIELSWETKDTIEEFQVTFQYDLWELTGPAVQARSSSSLSRTIL